MFHCFRISAA